MEVLIIDDDLSICNYLSKIVSDEGHHCRIAHDRRGAFAELEVHDIDLIMIDVYMPGSDGFEITKDIRKRFTETWIPIVFISASDSDADYKKCVEVGGDDYLVKPIRPIVVQTKLKTLERISAMKRLADSANKKLKRLTHLDPLTKVQNRRSLQHSLFQEWKSAHRNKTPLSVLMIDIDFFKSYNDSLGHLKGDSCLQKVAKALSQAITRPRDLVARYGGEEFLVLLPETDSYGASQVAARLHQAILEKGIDHPESEISDYITVSMGISSTDSCARSPEELCDQADKALYEAKKQGRNRTNVFSEVL